jgi:hypothetical protein
MLPNCSGELTANPPKTQYQASFRKIFESFCDLLRIDNFHAMCSFFCHSCESRNPAPFLTKQWIPAFAGMTGSWEKLHTA